MKTIEDMEAFLEHAGVKGMKWGVRKGEVTSTKAKTSKLRRGEQEVTVSQKPGKFVRTAGGKRNVASDDAVRVAANRQLAKRSTTDALSNKQLQDAVQRMNLETQYHTLTKKSDRRTRGQRMVSKILGNKKNQELAYKGATSGAKRVAKAMATTAAVA